MLVTSDKGLQFLRRKEGFEPEPYIDPAGHCTIGVGHLIHHGPCTSADYEQWGRLTEAEGLTILADDLEEYETAVRQLVEVPIRQGHFDALVSFAYNLGWGALQQSTLLRLLNASNYDGAADEFLRWDKAGSPPQPLPGLTRRRKAERRMFRRATRLQRLLGTRRRLRERVQRLDEKIKRLL